MLRIPDIDVILCSDEIVQTVFDLETFETNDSNSDELHDVQPILSHAKACEMLKECILWAEQQPETTGADIILLCSLMGISAKKQMSDLKQTKLTSFWGAPILFSEIGFCVASCSYIYYI